MTLKSEHAEDLRAEGKANVSHQNRTVTEGASGRRASEDEMEMKPEVPAVFCVYH